MCRFAPVAAVVLLVACGGVRAVHYNVRAALDCLQRTDSTMVVRLQRGIAIAFVAPDGVSAVEPVGVGFKPVNGDAVMNAAAGHGLGINKPVWTERRGDADVFGGGPYEPPIGKRQHIPDAEARAAAKELDARVRRSIDACLEQNER